jgi:hypothetical protein
MSAPESVEDGIQWREIPLGDPANVFQAVPARDGLAVF